MCTVNWRANVLDGLYKKCEKWGDSLYKKCEKWGDILYKKYGR